MIYCRIVLSDAIAGRGGQRGVVCEFKYKEEDRPRTLSPLEHAPRPIARKKLRKVTRTKKRRPGPHNSRTGPSHLLVTLDHSGPKRGGGCLRATRRLPLGKATSLANTEIVQYAPPFSLTMPRKAEMPEPRPRERSCPSCSVCTIRYPYDLQNPQPNQYQKRAVSSKTPSSRKGSIRAVSGGLGTSYADRQSHQVVSDHADMIPFFGRTGKRLFPSPDSDWTIGA